MTGVNAADASAAAAAAAAAAAPPSSSSSSSSWPKLLHKRCLKELTKSSATNVDMTLFHYLYEGPKGEEDKKAPPGDEAERKAKKRDNNNDKKHDDKAVLCALAPLRAAALVLPWQRRLARRVIEHKKVGAPGVVNFVVARQRWFDAQVAAFAGVQQVVALAAGYELRAHRCCSSSSSSTNTDSKAAVTFFEVDLPHASAKKQELVKKLKLNDQHVRYVPCDLSVPGQLRSKLEAAGFCAKKATLFTAEGLIYYLPASAVAALVREVGDIIKESSESSESSSSSRLALDYLHLDALEAGFAAGIGGLAAAVGAGDGDGGGDGGGKKKTKKDKKKKQKKAVKAANTTNKMQRAYEVTARSVAAKGEPFISGFGASPLEAAGFVASASAGALSLRAHSTTRAACDELLGCKAAEEHGVLGFYSFLVAEAAGPLPPSAPGGVGAVGAAVAAPDAVARVGV